MTNIAKITTSLFNSIAKLDDAQSEYWLARELMPLLGYERWESFHSVIQKAMTSLAKTYPQVGDHFRQTTKKIKVAAGTGKEAVREIIDYKLTRYACYLIAQNGDPKKDEIAQAQSYFANQTRKQELTQAQYKAVERLAARKKLSETEKKFAGVLASRGIDGHGIASIKSAGDEALFGSPTREVKQIMGIDNRKPLADHLPTISIKAKDLATEMTTFKTQDQNLHGQELILAAHVGNNQAVRDMLNSNGIYPERLPAEEDIKKLEHKVSQEEVEKVELTRLLSLGLLEIDIREVMDPVELAKIKETIYANQGDSKIRIFYGDQDSPSMIERAIQINAEVISALRKYIILVA